MTNVLGHFFTFRGSGPAVFKDVLRPPRQNLALLFFNSGRLFSDIIMIIVYFVYRT